MTRQPRVSVIISFLNSEIFLAESIETVYAQSFTDWELLLVDDGSTDRSTDIALKYRDKDPERVFYLEHDGHENKGISASRNLGIRHSRGKYIATLDSDDLWLPLKLEQQVEILENNPEAEMVLGNTKYWCSWTGNSSDISLDRYMHDNINSGTPILNTLVSPPLLLILTLNGQIDPASMSNIMLKKDTINKVGGFEEAFRGMHEDQAFLAKVYLSSSVFVSASCWDFYRQHRESCHQVSEKTGKQESAELFYLEWLENYLGERGITDPGVRDALNNRLWNFKNTALNEFRHAALQKAKDIVKALAPKLLPRSLGEAVISKYSGKRPLGWVNFGELRKITPLTESWGARKGSPIDEYYIDRFLKVNSTYIRGVVLESGNDLYAYKYGKENVIKDDVIKISVESGTADVALPPDTQYDCIIITRSLEFIYDPSSVIETLHRVLKPGGIILAAIPGMSSPSGEASRQYWNFTSTSARMLFERQFPPGNINVESFGNSLTAVSFLHGLVAEDLKVEELDYSDERYKVIIGVRASKPD